MTEICEFVRENPDVTVDDVLEHVDLEQVAKAMLPDDTKVPDFDIRDAKEVVLRAAEKWLLYDIRNFDLNAAESEALVLTPGEGDTAPHLHAVFDLQFVLRPDYQDKKALREAERGSYVIVDWKVTSVVDGRWLRRVEESWQWRIYSWAADCSLFIYRGLTRSGDQRQVLLPVPENNDKQVEDFLRGVAVMMDGLYRFSKTTFWPRNMPQSCQTWGRTCEYWPDCSRDNFVQGDNNFDIIPLSYSSISTFLLCPEKYRRQKATVAAPASSEMAFGDMVHRGLANLYAQVYGLRPVHWGDGSCSYYPVSEVPRNE